MTLISFQKLTMILFRNADKYYFLKCWQLDNILYVTKAANSFFPKCWQSQLSETLVTIISETLKTVCLENWQLSVPKCWQLHVFEMLANINVWNAGHYTSPKSELSQSMAPTIIITITIVPGADDNYHHHNNPCEWPKGRF